MDAMVARLVNIRTDAGAARMRAPADALAEPVRLAVV
jgi:hypothetical protein